MNDDTIDTIRIEALMRQWFYISCKHLLHHYVYFEKKAEKK